MSLRPHPGPAAAHPLQIATTGSGAEAGQGVASPAGLDARYEQLRHAVLHDRARAFPLGLGILIARGVTAWKRLLTSITVAAGTTPAHQNPPAPASRLQQPVPPPMPAQLTSQLVHVLADLAVTLAGG